MRLRTLLVGLAAMAAVPSTAGYAQSMPGMAMPTDRMDMASSTDLLDSMNQEASGTSWLPANSPIYGKMLMQPNGDMLMLHGMVAPRYTSTGSKRGDRRVDAPNWFMGMYGHTIDAKSQLGIRAMGSLDPITEGGNGYPLLYQTGETWHGQSLHDRQHPHDLIDELALSYSRLLAPNRSAFLYLGYPGEPALGPPTYMHRLLAYDFADAPIGHHWQDATHITFGVATAGINFGSRIKFEASRFTGREPDENRYSFDRPRFDSSSARLSYNPNDANALQVSYGFIKNPEGNSIDQHRITASWLTNRPLGPDSNVTTALVWGQNIEPGAAASNSYLAEADYQRGRNTFFTRLEMIQKSGGELVIPSPALADNLFRLGAYTVGYVRDITHGTRIDTGIGFAATANTHPAALDPFYGHGTPLGFQVYLRFRPSRLAMHSMFMAPGHAMPAPQGMPAMQMPAAPPAPVIAPPSVPTVPNKAAPAVHSVAIDLSPNPPHAAQDTVLTVTLKDPNGVGIVGGVATASAAMTTMDMGTTTIQMHDMGDGRYQGHIQFSMPGTWRVSAAIHVTGGPPSVFALDYPVQP